MLIDGVGGGYFWSGTYNHLQRGRRAGRPLPAFVLPVEMPFVNLRNHRKVLVVDGRIGFTGGINIGAENICWPTIRRIRVLDTHFRLEGPIVEQLTEAFADDWLYDDRREAARPRTGFPPLEKAGQAMARVVTSGPDEDIEQIEFVVLHAISCARSRSAWSRPISCRPIR